MPETDQDRWLSYAEIGELLGITSSAARMHARRRGWMRRSPNAIGGQTRVLVPADIVVHPCAPAVQRTYDAQMTAEANGADRANDQVRPAEVEALCAAVTALSATVTAERERVACAEQRFEALSAHAEQRFEELLAALTDARAAERIAAESAAGLRAEIAILTARRAWWRRWFQ
jgi:hypothetical protein